MMKKALTMLVMLLAFAAAMTAQESFVSGGITRQMIVYAPKNLPANRPLLISMHGMNQDMNYQKSQANYEAVADTAKFVVVYPNGIDKGWDIGGNRDTDFILDIIEEMVKRYDIDRNRVYLSGFSMGGMMTYHAMTKIADKIAAFAPVSGYNMGGPNATSSRPIPIIHVHGTGDDVCTYGPVQNHINAWVARNKCNTTPIVETRGTAKTGTLYRYTGGLNGVEVAHLKLPDKGHWHSNDPVCGMSNVEIWNFCKRWSLTPGPKLLSITPEDGSFDMTQAENSTFTLTFDKEVDCSTVRCGLIGPTSCLMKLQEKGTSKTLTFYVPTSHKMKEGNYSIKVMYINGTDGSSTGTMVFNYTYGITEVSEEYETKTVLVQDWASQQPLIGEGIPLGWERVNTSGSGTDKKTSGQANTGGARMKYFPDGGDIKAGFYLSAREYDKVDLTYGSTEGYPLTLAPGRYLVSLRSTYWTEGAYNSKNSFDMTLLNASTNAVIASVPGLKPKGCMYDSNESPVKTSQLHEEEIIVTGNAEVNCLLQFTMAAGWSGIILGEPTIITLPSYVEEYKGNFLRALSSAKRLDEQLSSGIVIGHESEIEQLRSTIAEYEAFKSISPSEHVAATQAVEAAVKALSGVKILAKGDVDGDGVISMADANIVVNAYLGMAEGTVDLRLADMDGDGIITMSDANAIVNLYLGIQ